MGNTVFVSTEAEWNAAVAGGLANVVLVNDIVFSLPPARMLVQNIYHC